MNIKELYDLRDKYLCLKDSIPTASLASFDADFAVEFTHDSTAIEGNTLTKIETKMVLEDGISIGGKPLREIYEVVNHKNALAFLSAKIVEKAPLDEVIAKEIHALLMTNIITGGVYRNCQVRITGASHKPPPPSEMYAQVKEFFAAMPEKSAQMDAITLAAYTHAEFVRIHPFEDGNGRASRLLMNYQLMAADFLPISIPLAGRTEYINALDGYAVSGDLQPFVRIIAAFEESKLSEYLSLVPEKTPPTPRKIDPDLDL
jgi:Fic family protein